MARNFAGGTDSISFGNLTFSGCIAFWIKTTQTTANALPFSAWSGTSRLGVGLILNNASANKLTLAGYDSTTQRVAVTTATSVNTGSWVHIGVNYNFSNGATQTIYVNGVSDASGTASAAWGYLTSAPITFGDPVDTFWPSFVGDLAECGIWNRSLTADEMMSLARGFAPPRVAPANFNFYCPFVRDHHNKKDGFVNAITGTTVSAHPRVMGSLP